LEEFVAKDPNARTIARLRELHPALVLAYLNPDGRKVAIYRSNRGRTNGAPPNFRWTVYSPNWKVTHASTEGFRKLSHALQNASAPTALPPVPELGSGILIKL
jgi:hypothetical protein